MKNRSIFTTHFQRNIFIYITFIKKKNQKINEVIIFNDKNLYFKFGIHVIQRLRIIYQKM
jgi:hypothetical protein